MTATLYAKVKAFSQTEKIIGLAPLLYSLGGSVMIFRGNLFQSQQAGGAWNVHTVGA